MKDTLSGRIANALTPAVGAVAFIFLWWLAAWLKLIDPVLLPSPQASAKAIWDGFVGGNLMKDLGITVRRTLAAFGIAVAVCVPLGLVLGPVMIAVTLALFDIFKRLGLSPAAERSKSSGVASTP